MSVTGSSRARRFLFPLKDEMLVYLKVESDATEKLSV